MWRLFIGGLFFGIGMMCFLNAGLIYFGYFVVK